MTDLRRYAWLSVAAAIATILLKGAAWWMTGSVGLLSDAIESFVNLAGALMALWMLTLAAQPADDNHPHGHGKAEYFSSAFEGFLIVVAAVSIAYTAIDRLLHPQPLEAGRHRPAGLVGGFGHQLLHRQRFCCAPGASTAQSRLKPTPTT
jgi:cation diffusion facilitator family transporter